MGAGRRTQTVAVTASSGSGSGGGNLGPPRQRNLGKGELGAVIFGCTDATISECLNQNLFGLPAQHFRYVKHIEAGMPLFLFNYFGRTMHGIFEATGDGALNINPNAWQADKTSRTQFPAQVLLIFFICLWRPSGCLHCLMHPTISMRKSSQGRTFTTFFDVNHGSLGFRLRDYKIFFCLQDVSAGYLFVQLFFLYAGKV
jgi:hypothetical protein